MKYEVVKTISPEWVEVRSETGQTFIGDKVDFGMALKENIRREIGRELQEIMAAAAGQPGEGLITYSDLVKLDDHMYLLREPLVRELYRFQPASIVDACRGLLTVLQIMQGFHRRGEVMGGLSRGQLRVAKDGRILLEDPRVWNYLNKRVADEAYRVCPAPEVIRGRPWTPQADLFSWGVLAYELLTGRSPYNAVKSEDYTAQILRGKVASARDYRPQMSQELDRLISRVLSGDPEKRPPLEELISKLSQYMADGTCEARADEITQYAGKAARHRRRHQSRERVWLWFRKHGTVTISIVAVVVTGFFLMTGFRTKPVLTVATTPSEVVNYYFNGVRQVNVPLVAETLHRAKNSLEDVVANVHVLNMQAMAYTTGQERLKISIDNLQIEKLLETDKEVKYRVGYWFRINLPEKDQLMRRVDEFTLRPVKKVWKITDIKVLSEDRTE